MYVCVQTRVRVMNACACVMYVFVDAYVGACLCTYVMYGVHAMRGL